MASRILGLVPARAGSKRIPKKNLRILGNKPLVEWTLVEAINSKGLTDVVVSTDSEQIAELVLNLNLGTPLIRPTELASDSAGILDVVLHALTFYEGYEYIMVLQPTSPLRRADHIDNAIDLCVSNGLESLISVTESRKPSNFFVMTMQDGDQGPVKIIDRQNDRFRTELINGALYLASVEYILDRKALYGPGSYVYRMSEESSVDIDDEFDWQLAEFLISERDKK